MDWKERVFTGWSCLQAFTTPRRMTDKGRRCTSEKQTKKKSQVTNTPESGHTAAGCMRGKGKGMAQKAEGRVPREKLG